MEKFFSKIEEYFKKTKNPFLQMPPGVTSLFNERHGDWSFSFTLKSTLTYPYTVAILPGCVPTERVVQIIDDGLNNAYIGMGGALIPAPLPVGSVVLLHDEVKHFNPYSGVDVRAVINQELTQNFNNRLQYIFKTNSFDVGEISVESINGVDILRNMMRQNAVRIYEIHIQSSNEDMFSTQMIIKDTNPFKNSAIEYINLEDWFKPDNALSKKIIVDKPFFLDNMTLLALNLPGNTEVTITLRGSVMFRPAKGIELLTDMQDFMRDIKEYKQ